MNNKKKALLTTGAVGMGFLARELFARKNEEDLKGKVVLITGGSKGLGVALARAFAVEGCKLAICARHREELHSAKRELEAGGTEIIAVPCDVSDEAQVKQMIAEVEARYGRIDILVNNAGQIQVGPVTAMTAADFESAMNVMFWGTVFPTLQLIPEMVNRKSGKIVNITSVGGKVSVPHLVPYTCAKFAATGFSEGLRSELAPQGVQVSTIAPGMMRTGSFVNALFKGDQEAEAKWFSAGSSLPFFTMTAERAAKKIVTAVKRNEAETILTTGAKAISGFHGAFPGAAANLLGVIAAGVLPAMTGQTGTKQGRDIAALKSPWMKVALTLGRAAIGKYRQQAA